MIRSRPYEAWRWLENDQKGLTVIEVLITIIILSMAGVIAAESIRLGRRFWERQQTQVDTEQSIRVIYDILAQEIASLQPVIELVDGKRVIAFDGRADQIFFYARPDPYQPFPYNAMVRGLSLSVDREKGLIVHESYPLIVDEQSRSRVRVVDRKVTKIAFRFLLSSAESLGEANWLDQWSATDFARPLDQKAQKTPAALGQNGNENAASDLRNGLPLAIGVSVTISRERGEHIFDFLVPIHVGGYL